MADPQSPSPMSDSCLEFANPEDTLDDWLAGDTVLSGHPLPSPTCSQPRAESTLEATTETTAPPLGSSRRGYRIRLLRFDRPESRSMQIEADTESAARSQAGRDAGPEWRVVGICPV